MKLLFCINAIWIANAFLYKDVPKIYTPSLIKKEMSIDAYEVTWDNGEVEWEFENTREIYYPVSQLYSYEKKDIKEERIDNTLLHNIEKSLITDAVFSAALKTVYNELVRMEIVLEEANELISDSISNTDLNSDLFLITASLLLGFHYSQKRIRVSSLSTLDSEIKVKYIQDYKKIRKTVQLLFLIFVFVFTKNVRNAE
jgi:hypothetical protein